MQKKLKKVGGKPKNPKIFSNGNALVPYSTVHNLINSVKGMTIRGAKPKPKRKRKGKVQRKRAAPPIVWANANPFDIKAKGAKWLDDSTTDSTTYVAKTLLTPNGDSSFGCTVTVFRSSPAGAYVYGTPASATTCTFPGGYSGIQSVTNASTLQGYFSAYRCVGFGVRLTTRLNFNSAALSGNVHVCVVPDVFGNDSTSWQYPTAVSVMENLPSYTKFSVTSLIENPRVITAQYTSAEATEYRALAAQDFDTSVVTNARTVEGWNVIMVFYEGSSASIGASPIDFEYISHLEVLPKVLGTTSSLPVATSPSPHMPMVQAAVNNTVQNLPPVVETASDDEGLSWLNSVYDCWEAGLDIAQGVTTLAGKTMTVAEDIAGVIGWAM